MESCMHPLLFGCPRPKTRSAIRMPPAGSARRGSSAGLTKPKSGAFGSTRGRKSNATSLAATVDTLNSARSSSSRKSDSTIAEAPSAATMDAEASAPAVEVAAPAPDPAALRRVSEEQCESFVFRSDNAIVDPGPAPRLAGVSTVPPLRLATGQPLLLLSAHRSSGGDDVPILGIVGESERRVVPLMTAGGDNLAAEEREHERELAMDGFSAVALPWAPPAGGSTSIGWTTQLLADISTLRVPLRKALAHLRGCSAKLNDLHVNQRGAGEGATEAKEKVAKSAKALEDATREAESAAEEAAAAREKVCEIPSDASRSLLVPSVAFCNLLMPSATFGCLQVREKQQAAAQSKQAAGDAGESVDEAKRAEKDAKKEAEAMGTAHEEAVRVFEDAQKTHRSTRDALAAAQKATVASFQAQAEVDAEKAAEVCARLREIVRYCGSCAVETAPVTAPLDVPYCRDTPMTAPSAVPLACR